MNRKIIYTSKAPEPIGPYSQAILIKDTLYISGQIPIDAQTGKVMEDDIASETDQVMKNIGYILQEAGMDLTNVVKCSIFITDINNFHIVNNEYQKYFTNNHPARETIEVSQLPKGVNVEISCIAVV